MSAASRTIADLSGVPRSRRDLASFGGRRGRRGVVVYEPKNENELLELLASAHARGIRFAPLGSALSFDGQGLPERVAVSTARLDSLRVDPTSRLLVAGAGATTGAALSAALRHGLAPPVMPSSSRVSLGGSVSSDAYSRMTPGFGRESRHVRRIRLATARGQIHECSRDQNTDLFHAALGGFGLVGVITAIEHALQPVGRRAALVSSAHAFDGVDGLEFLFPECRPPGLAPGSWPGAGCIVMQRGTRRRTLITRHRMDDTPRRRRTLAHDSGPLRVGLELLVGELPALTSWLWQANWVPGRVVSFVDDLAPATFFMDGNVKAKHVARRWGRAADVVQQSFALPIEERSSAEVDRVESFVREALDRLRDAGLTAGMFDVGFLPRSEPFLLSANPTQDAFLVSLAFTTRHPARVDTISRILRKLTSVCRKTHGGRLHLAKQAECSDEELRDMYRTPIERLRRLRATHDPGSLIDTVLAQRLGL